MNYIVGALGCLSLVLIWYIYKLRKEEEDKSVYLGKLQDESNKNEDAIVKEFDNKIDDIKKVSINTNEEVVNYLTRNNKPN